MDMSRFSKATGVRDDAQTLKEHTAAIKSNQVSVALMILYLAGYEVELNDTGQPRAGAAREALDELSYDGVSIWSCSTSRGGIWETWQRSCLKTGTNEAYDRWALRHGS